MKYHNPAQRIIQLVDYCKYKKIKGIDSDAAFRKVCGIKDSTMITSLRGGKNKNPGILLVEKICRATGASAEWIVMGNGEMFPAKKAEGLDVEALKEKLNEALEILTINNEI